ncbi:MAG: hypothetical protein NC548_28660 [Lachnospiraceae bacterium]|nr:hypothetical protein [Lachnospiraceae bacterium]
MSERCSAAVLKTSDKPQSWGYIFLHNMVVKAFEEKVRAYNALHIGSQHACFVHRSYRYKVRSNGKGAKKELCPTVSGLVFLQGRTRDLQVFLKGNFPQYHLVKNCSTGEPASIEHKVMEPFMAAMSANPENVTFLREPFERFARDRVRLRVLSGLFKGQEGYIVRIDRDRQLVMEFAGYAVAIRGLHKEDFEEVK